MDAQPSLAKDPESEKGSPLLQSSPGHHLLPYRPCLGRAVPHKCLGVRGNWVRDRNRGVGDIKKVLLEGGRPGSVEGRKNGLGLESSPGLGFKS